VLVERRGLAWVGNFLPRFKSLHAEQFDKCSMPENNKKSGGKTSINVSENAIIFPSGPQYI
jgi:hypothetical protein